MSDSFQMLVDAEVALDGAERFAKMLVSRFQEIGLIGELAEGAGLGRDGYRPGRRVAELYRLADGEQPFWGLVTCGVEPRTGRQLNELALGPAFERLTCPVCLTGYEELPEALDSAVMDALEAWLGDSIEIDVRCPACQNESPITAWEASPPIGFGNLALVFWNWPPLDATGWQLDIVAIMEELTGHHVVRTHGAL